MTCSQFSDSYLHVTSLGLIYLHCCMFHCRFTGNLCIDTLRSSGHPFCLVITELPVPAYLVAQLTHGLPFVFSLYSVWLAISFPLISWLFMNCCFYKFIALGSYHGGPHHVCSHVEPDFGTRSTASILVHRKEFSIPVVAVVETFLFWSILTSLLRWLNCYGLTVGRNVIV